MSLLYICQNSQKVQHQECTLKYELWMIMMCQCRLNDCDRGTTEVQDVYSAGGLHRGAGGIL